MNDDRNSDKTCITLFFAAMIEGLNHGRGLYSNFRVYIDGTNIPCYYNKLSDIFWEILKLGSIDIVKKHN